MNYYSYAEAVRDALGVTDSEGTFVPCLRPFTGIELLQLIKKGQVKRYGFFRVNQVLRSPGDDADTLITRTLLRDANLNGELSTIVDSTSDGLSKLVDRAFAHPIAWLEKEQMASLKAALAFDTGSGTSDSTLLPNNVSPKKTWKVQRYPSDVSLARVGLKEISDESWILSSSRIVRKTVECYELRAILSDSNPNWGLSPNEGVVSAIYAISGGLIFTGHAEAVTKAGRTLEATPDVSVEITTGWHYTKTKTGEVVLTEVDPVDWIIAIEYVKLEEVMRHERPPILRLDITNGQDSWLGAVSSAIGTGLGMAGKHPLNDEDSFPGAVRSAIGTGVPCCWPFSGIKLLQVFDLDKVNGKVFREPTIESHRGFSRLQELLEDELKDLVKGACDEHVVTLNEKQVASLKAGFLSRFLRTSGLPLKVTTDNSWHVSIKDEKVKRRAVSHHDLRKVFQVRPLPVMCLMGDVLARMRVITAIYFISGGVTFTANAKAVRRSGEELQPTSEPVVISEGWEYTVRETGSVIVAETDPIEWIIAIEYREVKAAIYDAARGSRQLIPIDQKPAILGCCGNEFAKTACP